MTTIPELTQTFARIGILSFGGPAAQIAMMHRELVDEKQWVTEEEYLSALSFCMLLPGPEAMQLATWIGWRKLGTLGGLIAGGLFVLPGAVIVLALSMIYAAFGTVPLVAALFIGVQAAVLAVVAEALLRVSKRALKSRAQWAIAVLAFVALFFFAAPFPAVILSAGLWGFFTVKSDPSASQTTPAPWAQSLRATAIWGAVWLIPLCLIVLFGPDILADIALFFSKLAMLTFGGAYAVLTWMAQDVVQQKQWLTLPQMIDGLGLAETTPGPLILVTEFVGYLAAAKHGVAMGLAGALITLWMTFAPCFLWVFAGAPWIARLTHAPRLSQALKAITAAVVGVIANLSLWFAAHVIFATVTPLTYGPLHLIWPDPSSLKLLATALALLAAYLLLRRHWPLPIVLGLCAITSAAVAAF
ncbi:MAG: chromate efflux transporter [Cypionkella sp.]|uniref:chromate efflux transporter n=1 Tax=Cypionkella sp. TaxID=2811411 RepID=UPI002ABD01BD|nr:chromate efflux transporter [Cypionkella sp.]MDZ4311505.1 chromate efflux transporter [Cypionkella sp.]